jgi:hypothetical protein
VTAQGNALGPVDETNRALKGRHRRYFTLSELDETHRIPRALPWAITLRRDAAEITGNAALDALVDVNDLIRENEATVVPASFDRASSISMVGYHRQ